MPAGLPRLSGKTALVLGGLAAACATAVVLAAVRGDSKASSSAAVLNEIAYVSTADGNFEIYVISPDGSGRTRLTDDPGEDRFPAWSPDGTRIAFASDRGGDFDIYTMARDGSSLQRLTFDPARDTDPAWSPDGKSIAFRSDRDGENAIYLLELKSGKTRRVTPEGLAVLQTNVDWSPDGSRLVFAAQPNDDLAIYTIKLDGTGLVRVTGSDRRQGILDPGLVAGRFAHRVYLAARRRLRDLQRQALWRRPRSPDRTARPRHQPRLVARQRLDRLHLRPRRPPRPLRDACSELVERVRRRLRSPPPDNRRRRARARLAVKPLHRVCHSDGGGIPKEASINN